MKAKIMQKMTVTAAAARKMKTKIIEKMGVSEAAISRNPDVTTRRQTDVSVEQEIILHI